MHVSSSGTEGVVWDCVDVEHRTPYSAPEHTNLFTREKMACNVCEVPKVDQNGT